MQTSRPPIAVILGHVDHGKTTLLDYLRHTQIAAREAGGITQATRSFQYASPSGLITFIDTPGHAAFSAMRSRGSQLADLAVLVVASDDGVQPQTLESIEFIQKIKLPFLVAITKSDLPAADPDRVKTQLTEHQVIVEDFGGSVPAVSVSAKTGAGISDLVDIIHLISQLHPPQADPAGSLEAIVLESRTTAQTGPSATVLVKSGTLAVGQKLYQAAEIGKVRNLSDPEGHPVTSAPPSVPVDIIGLSVVPEVGTVIFDLPTPSSQSTASTPSPSTLPASVKLIIKADVAGSLEALLAALPAEVSALSSGLGDINETDVTLARSSLCPIFGFNVKVPSSVAKLAEVEKVSIYNFKIIYELLDQVIKLIRPTVTEKLLGTAQVVAEFKMNSERIAGCRAASGIISRGSQIRVLRGDQVVGETKIRSLKSGKSDIQTVKSGSEFGAVFHPYVDFKVGDSLTAFER